MIAPLSSQSGTGIRRAGCSGQTRALAAALALLTWVPSAASEPLLLRAGILLDGRGGLRRNARIVVEGSRIVDVETEAAGHAVRAPGARVYDLSGLTVLPGLIDVHAHPSWYFTAAGRLRTEKDGDSPAQATLAEAGNAYETLRSGFTTLQSPGAPEDKEVRDAI